MAQLAGEFGADYQDYDTDVPQLKHFLDYITLSSQDDSVQEAKTVAVNLMTCHKSKGLEFPVVFVPGVQVGVFPNDFFIRTPEDLESERRLFYVSITRAINRLYITCNADPFCGKGLVEKGFLAEMPGIVIQNEPSPAIGGTTNDYERDEYI